MPKLKHPKTGDVITTESNILAVDLRANHGYKVVEEKPQPEPKTAPKPSEVADKTSK